MAEASPLGRRLLELAADDAHLDELTATLVGLAEKDRRAAARTVLAGLDTSRWNRRGGVGPTLLALGCVTGLRQVVQAVQNEWLPGWAVPAAVRVLDARRPSWLAELPGALLTAEFPLTGAFGLVRALVRAGVVDRPTGPEYVVGMVGGIVPPETWLEWVGGGRRDPTGRTAVLAELDADPALVDDEVWALFTTERAGRALAAYDHERLNPWAAPNRPTPPTQPELTWQHAVVELVRRGAMDRDRVLDAALGAAQQDWSPVDVRWFLRLYEALGPTTDEAAARQGTLARLLAAPDGPPVALATRSFTALLKARRLDVETLLDAAPAAMVRPDKTSVAALLTLLAAVAKAEPASARRVAAVAAAGLEHPRADVQERTLRVLGALVPDEGERAELVAPYSDAVTPTLRSALPRPPGKVDGEDTVAEPAAGEPEPALPSPRPPALTGPAAVPTAVPQRRVDPVAGVAGPDELAELFGALLEDPGDPIGVERALEGAVRLAGRRPADGARLRRRLDDTAHADHVYPPWSGESLRPLLAALAVAWLDGRPPRAHYPGRHGGFDGPANRHGERRIVWEPDWTLTTLIARRVRAAADHAARGRPGVLLSLPTSSDGALSADALAARVAAAGRLDAPLALDAGVAALRVVPAERAAVVLPRAHRVAGAVRAALDVVAGHAPSWQRVVGPARGRFSQPTPPMVAWADPAAPAGSPLDAAAGALDRRDPLRLAGHEASDGEYVGDFHHVAALWPLLLPHHPDVLASHAHARLDRALTQPRSAAEPLLDALAARGAPSGPVCSAVVLGLAAREAVTRTAAVDALIELAARHPGLGPVLGDQLAAVLTDDLVVGTRVADALVEAARAEPAASRAVLDALVAALPALPGRRDAHRFVDLLAALATEHGRRVALPGPLAAAASSSSGSVLARACRRVPG